MNLINFTETFNEVALNPNGWADLLHDLSREVGAVGAILISASHKLPNPPVSKDLTSLLDIYYEKGWNLEDIRFRGMETALRKGAVVDQDILTIEEMDHAAFYQDLLRPYDCKWFCAIPFLVAGEYWFLSIQRTSKQGLFSPDEVKSLKRLAQPLGDAARLSHALSFSRILGMSDAFDSLSQPAFFLDESGQLISCSEVATHWISNVLTFRSRFPQFYIQKSQRDYDRCMAVVNDISNDDARYSPITCVVHDRNGKSFTLNFTRLTGWASYSFARARTLVTISRINMDVRDPNQILRHRYALTSAELRVALALRSGLSVRLTAEAHGIAYETARPHLRSIYHKTGVSHQSALIRLLNDVHSAQS